VPAGDTLPVRAGRALVELVTTTASTRELTELVTAVQAPVTTGRRIAVVSVCGGAGRTTTTALLGGVFAARRADHVLVADGDPDTAALAWRVGLTPAPDPARTAAALLGVRGGTLADVDALLPATAAGLRLLTGPRPGESPRVAQVAEALSRFFAIGVLDCPRGLDAAAEAGQGAHARVLVCPLTPAGLRTTAAALDRPGAPRPDVIALVALGPTGRAAVGGGAERVLDRLGVPVLVVPHDRHLAAGAPIDLARLGRATVLAATRLAGTALAAAGPAGAGR
jgi:MinD-like ATPase involved in chromosome partitioning or flagellar assembly